MNASDRRLPENMVLESQSGARKSSARRAARDPSYRGDGEQERMVETEYTERMGRRENSTELRFSYALNHLGRKGLREALDLVEYSIRGQYKGCFYKGSTSGYELETFDTEFENGSLLHKLPRILQKTDEMISTVPLANLVAAWQWQPILQLAALFSPERYEEIVKTLQPSEIAILVAARLEAAGLYEPIERVLKWGGGFETWPGNVEMDDEVKDILGRLRKMRVKTERVEWGGQWGN